MTQKSIKKLKKSEIKSVVFQQLNRLGVLYFRNTPFVLVMFYVILVKNLAIAPTHGNNVAAMNRLTPVWAIAIRSVSPFGIPSDTNNPANHIVPVVPRLAPRTQAIAAGNGMAPEATKAIIAVVDNDEDCHNKVITIPPKNMKTILLVK